MKWEVDGRLDKSLDHLKLVRRKTGEVRKGMRIFSAPAGSFTDLRIWHEADDSCCKVEPWGTTRAWLLKETKRRTLVVEA